MASSTQSSTPTRWPLARSRRRCATAGYLYIDLRRQVLFDVRGGRVERAIPVSTGGGYPYTSSNGNTYIARSPTGSFRIYREVAGWQQSYRVLPPERDRDPRHRSLTSAPTRHLRVGDGPEARAWFPRAQSEGTERLITAAR